MAAPALHDLRTDSAISSGWVGRFGFDAFDAMPPVGATVIMVLLLTRFSLTRPRLAFPPAAVRGSDEVLGPINARNRPCGYTVLGAQQTSPPAHCAE